MRHFSQYWNVNIKNFDNFSKILADIIQWGILLTTAEIDCLIYLALSVAFTNIKKL